MNSTEHAAYLKVGFLISGYIILMVVPLRLWTVENATITGEWKYYLVGLGVGTLGLWATMAATVRLTNKFSHRIENYSLKDFDLLEIEKEPVIYTDSRLFNIYAVSDMLIHQSAAFAFAVGIAMAMNMFDNPWIFVVLAILLLVSLTLGALGILAIFPWFYSTFRIRCAKCDNRIICAKIRPRPEYRSRKTRSAITRYFWPDQLADKRFTCPNCCALNIVVKSAS